MDDGCSLQRMNSKIQTSLRGFTEPCVLGKAVAIPVYEEAFPLSMTVCNSSGDSHVVVPPPRYDVQGWGFSTSFN